MTRNLPINTDAAIMAFRFEGHEDPIPTMVTFLGVRPQQSGYWISYGGRTLPAAYELIDGAMVLAFTA